MAWSRQFFWNPDLLGRGFSFPERPEDDNSRAREEYWSNDEKWTEIYKSIENARVVIRAFSSHKVSNCVKYLNSATKFENLRIISVHHEVFFDLEQFRLNGGDIFYRPGEKVPVVYTDPELFAQFPKYLLPSYNIKNTAEPILGNFCLVCDLSIDCKVNCASCGITLCSLCCNHKIILYLGHNRTRPICVYCSQENDDINALLWIKRAEFAVKCGENAAGRLFLKIGYKYAITDTNSLSPQVSNALKQVEKSASEVQDYKTRIICLELQGVKGFQWATEARKMCNEGTFMYPFALCCLKKIHVPMSQQNEITWETLGDRLGEFHEDLAFFCYNQCSTISEGKWIEKAKINDEVARKREVTHKMTFYCLQQLIRKTGNVTQIVDQFFREGRYRLALYALKAGAVPHGQVIELLTRRYNNLDMAVVIALMKYITHTFSATAINELRTDVSVLLMLSQIHKLSQLSTIAELLHDLDITYRYESYHIPLAFIRASEVGVASSWDELAEIAVVLGCPHASRVLKKMSDIAEILNDGTESYTSSRMDVNAPSWIEELLN